jgi:hypothetical protein
MRGLVCLLGAIGLIAAFLTWAFFHLRFRMRRSVARSSADNLFNAPSRISLKRLEPFAWTKAARAEPRVDAFRALGFTEVCGFAAGGDIPARLYLLRHPGTGLLGLVQERGPAGTWSDAAFFPESAPYPIWASSVLNRTGFFLCPGDPKVHLPDASEAELVRTVEKAIETGSRPVRVTPENAKELMEESYATAADARLLHPPEDAELRRLLKEKCAACTDEELSDAEFQRIKQQLPFGIGNALRRACRDQFLRDGTVTAQEWQRAKPQLLVVHDRTPLHVLAERGSDLAYCVPGLKQRLLASARDAGLPRPKFAALNGALPSWERYRKLGEVTRPVPADIYCALSQTQFT